MRQIFFWLFFLITIVFVPANFVFGQDQNPGIFIPFTQNIPSEVLKTKNESMVSLRSSVLAWGESFNINPEHLFGCGLTVWENHVLTSLHLFGRHPAAWRGTDQYPTTAMIFDGQSFFRVKIVFLDPEADLALLKVETPNEYGQIFSKKPAKIAAVTSITDPTSQEQRVLYEKFYTFNFYIDHINFFYTMTLGPYLAITNSINNGYPLTHPLGKIQGTVERGFSGGPLLAPNGVVMGLLSSGSDSYTWVVTVETINAFLKNASLHLGLDMEGKPVTPVEPTGPAEPEIK